MLQAKNLPIIPTVESQKQSLKHFSLLTDNWHSLGTVTTDKVTECSIAGDDNRLIVFYREPRTDLNQDWGILKE